MRLLVIFSVVINEIRFTQCNFTAASRREIRAMLLCIARSSIHRAQFSSRFKFSLLQEPEPNMVLPEEEEERKPTAAPATTADSSAHSAAWDWRRFTPEGRRGLRAGDAELLREEGVAPVWAHWLQGTGPTPTPQTLLTHDAARSWLMPTRTFFKLF